MRTMLATLIAIAVSATSAFAAPEENVPGLL